MEIFKGQKVIVTGATRGIGKTISEAFVNEGAHVIGIYGGNRKTADLFLEENTEHASSLTLFRCDVSDKNAVQELFAEIEEQFEDIDVLINNAGIRKDSILALMQDQDWQDVINVNLSGTFFMCKHAVMLMMKKKYGRIINITSPVSHLGFSGQANYAASKAGQIGLTRTLAKEVARKKITVNCVSPGFIATEFINDLSKEQVAAYKKMVPMRRFGTPQEIAESVLFLAGPGAGYITGAVLEITGGL
ncbi:3-oxoacyl-ACP reductase FabG [Desulfomarina sp.]